YTCGPNCQPTRAALVTGQYGPRTGVYTVGGTDRFDTSRRPLVPVENVQQLPLDKRTLGQAMKQAGYATALFGKWHLGQQGRHHPSARGYDRAITSMGQHFGFRTQPPVDHPKDAYLADWLTDRSLEFIEENRSRPFFLELHHFGVHVPHEAKPALVRKFRGKPPEGGHHDPTYAAMIASLDESVGRVVAKLEELKLTENTLVIFTSDNGGVGGYVAAGVKTREGITDNAPLRGGKGMLYEGGVRVPWVASWPGTVRPGVTDVPINSVDFFPTLMELAGGAARTGDVLDGTSFAPLLTGGNLGERKPMFWHFPGYLGSGKNVWRTTPAGSVRAGDWKLIEFFEDGRVELYNLEMTSASRTTWPPRMPEKRDELHKLLRDWRASVHAPDAGAQGQGQPRNHWTSRRPVTSHARRFTHDRIDARPPRRTLLAPLAGSRAEPRVRLRRRPAVRRDERRAEGAGERPLPGSRPRTWTASPPKGAVPQRLRGQLALLAEPRARATWAGVTTAERDL
ncbi:MAG: sulfatase, partial [Isosphaeraceae bacterium]